MRVSAVPGWLTLVFSLIYWARITEPVAWAQTSASCRQRKRLEGKKIQGREAYWETRPEIGRNRKVYGVEKRPKDREALLIYPFFQKDEAVQSKAILWPELHIWGVTNALGPINNGSPSSLQQMGPTASAPAPPLQEAHRGAAARSKKPHREKWSSWK